MMENETFKGRSLMSPHFIGRLAAWSTLLQGIMHSARFVSLWAHYISKFPGLLSTSCLSEHTQSHELKLIVSSEY